MRQTLQIRIRFDRPRFNPATLETNKKQHCFIIFSNSSSVPNGKRSVLSQVKLLCAKAHDLWDTLAVKMFVKLGPSNTLANNFHCHLHVFSYKMAILGRQSHYKLSPFHVHMWYYIWFKVQFLFSSRDIHIECSKQFKWNSYFYVSGQSQPFWAALKLL